MQVILQEDVAKVGQMGDVVNVRDGYARNYLIPRGLAIEADPRSLRALAHQKRLIADKRERERKAAQGVAAQLAGVDLVVAVRVGEEGRLFGSVTSLDLQRLLAERGVTVDRKNILLEGPIKAVGDYEVPVHLGPDVRGTVRVRVVPHEEPAEAP